MLLATCDMRDGILPYLSCLARGNYGICSNQCCIRKLLFRCRKCNYRPKDSLGYRTGSRTYFLSWQFFRLSPLIKRWRLDEEEFQEESSDEERRDWQGKNVLKLFSLFFNHIHEKLECAPFQVLSFQMGDISSLIMITR